MQAYTNQLFYKATTQPLALQKPYPVERLTLKTI